MAASCKSKCFLNQRLSLVMITAWLFSLTVIADPITVKGEAGGNVTIPCPIEGQFEFFYFQRGTEYVNGYHSTRNLKKTQPWHNTRLGEDNRTVHMYNLNISHSGYYVCYVKYVGKDLIHGSDVHLNVTAKFTKPEVKMNCDNALSCMVTCSSYGGYPENKMSWSVPGSVEWNVVNTSMTPDQNTMMSTSSSTAYFNCSNGELEFIRCSVGEVTSDMFSVCTPQLLPWNPVIPIAIVALVVIGIIVPPLPLLLFWKCKKRRTGATAEVRQEWGVNGQMEEEVQLNNKAS